MSKLTFDGVSREFLEAEVNRCNDVMIADGKKLGEWRGLIARLEIMARGFHRGEAPSGNVDDVTRRETILAQANAVIREHFVKA
jgi:hypothetical protein